MSPTTRCPCSPLHVVACTLSATRCAQLRTSARTPPRTGAHTHACARTHARARACGSLWWGTAQAPAAAKQEDEVRPLWRPAFLAHVAAVMLTALIGVRLRLRVCRVHCRLPAMSSAARRLSASMHFVSFILFVARYASHEFCCSLCAALLSAACCLLHVVCSTLSAACCLLHVVQNVLWASAARWWLHAVRCTSSTACCLLHGCPMRVDAACCVRCMLSAARFRPPHVSFTVSASGYLLHVVFFCSSSVCCLLHVVCCIA